jgi:hypothetical protein
VEFARVGNRDYIQGISIACAMARTAGTRSPHTLPLRIKHVKFTRKTLCDGGVVVSAQGCETDLPAGTVAVLRGITPAGSVCAGYLPDVHRPVQRTISGHFYEIEPVDALCDFSGIWSARCMDTEHFLLSLIEINKRTIQASLPAPSGGAVIDLVYAEEVDFDLPSIFREGRIIVRNLGVREFGGLLYVLNELAYTDHRGTRQKVRLNYSVRK